MGIYGASILVRYQVGRLGSHMSMNRSKQIGLRHVALKLESLGVGNTEIDAVLNRMNVVAAIKRSEEIMSFCRPAKHLVVLLEGVACSYERLPKGNRQIYGYHYAGDFCDLHRRLLPASGHGVSIEAVTDCSIGVIKHADLEELIARYPSLSLGVWRSAMLEACISRKGILNTRRSALERVAHLLCEVLARREAVGIKSPSIPLSQTDLADAAGLSAVHINRTFKQLRTLNLLAKEGRTMKVVDRSRLAALAGFDGSYLNMPELLAGWQLEIDAPRRGQESSLGRIGSQLLVLRAV